MKQLFWNVAVVLAGILSIGAPVGASLQNEICKDGAWKLYEFASQGQCVALVKSGEVKVWGLFRDFLFYPYQQNPSPDQYGNTAVWSYFYSQTLEHDPFNYALYEHYVIEWDGWRESWTADPANPYNIPLLGAMPSQGEAALHPSNTSLSIASWRSPIVGTVAVNGYFFDPQGECGGGVDWAVERETADGLVSVAQGTIEGPSSTFNERFSFNFSLPVEVDDEIYFVIDPGPEFSDCDTTLSDITIVGPVPADSN